MKGIINNQFHTVHEFINYINDLVFVMEVLPGSTFRYVIINQAAKESLGVSEEIINKKLEEVVPKNKAKFLLNQYKKVLKKKKQVTFEYNENDDKFEETSLSPFFDKNNNISHIVAISRDFSRRKKLEKELIINEQKYKSIVDNNTDSVFMIDLCGRFLSLNKAGEQLCGYKESEIYLKSFTEILLEEDMSLINEHFHKALLGDPQEYKVNVIHKNGEILHCSIKNIPIVVDGKVIGVYGIAKDITKDHVMLQILKENEAYFRTLIERSPDPTIILQDGYIVFANHAFSTFIEAGSREQVIGKPINDFIPFQNRVMLRERTKNILEGMVDVSSVEESIITLSGKRKDVEIFTTTTSFKNEPAVHSVLRDITERKKMERKIKKMAFYDYLTDLPNRQLFKEYLDETIELRKEDNRSFALLFIDGDKFKEVNDTLGHDGGDEFLKEFGNRLSHSVQGDDIVARVGGDEFNVLLPTMDSKQGVEEKIKKMNSHLKEPWEYDGTVFKMSTSVGIAWFPNDGENVKELVRKADEALYVVKQKGGNGYHFYQS